MRVLGDIAAGFTGFTDLTNETQHVQIHYGKDPKFSPQKVASLFTWDPPDPHARFSIGTLQSPEAKRHLPDLLAGVTCT